MQKTCTPQEELADLKFLLQSPKPFVIEFSGSKNKNENSFVEICSDFFKGNGYKIKTVDSKPHTSKYERDYVKDGQGLSLNDRNLLITYEITSSLLSKLSDNHDIIILDESIFNRLIWLQRFIYRKELSEEEFKRYVKYYLPEIENLINYSLLLYSEILSETAEDYPDHSQETDQEAAIICCQYLLNGRNLLSDTDEENELNYRVLGTLLPIMNEDYIKQLKFMLEKKGRE